MMRFFTARGLTELSSTGVSAPVLSTSSLDSGHRASFLRAGMSRCVVFPNTVEPIRVEIDCLTGVQKVNRRFVIYENLL